MEEIKFKVCVRCYTFNQASYIEDAMNGFSMQQTSFPFVCCIVDDASTDGEQEVIRNYLQENFELEDKSVVRNEETNDYFLTFARHKINYNCFFAVMCLKYNHYKKKSKALYLKEWRAHSKYEAICEGDDYWIDKEKLQIQVDEMDKNDEIEICAHTAVRMKNKMIHGYIRPIKTNGVIPVERVIEDGGGLVATNSLLIRTDVYDNIYAYQKVMGGDHSIQIRGALRGGMLFIDREMSVYRVMAANSWSSRISSDKDLAIRYFDRQLKMLDVLNEETLFLYNDSIDRRKTSISFQKAYYFRDWQELKNKKYNSIIKQLPNRQKVQMFLNHHTPWLSQPVATIVDILYTIKSLHKFFL